MRINVQQFKRTWQKAFQINLFALYRKLAGTNIWQNPPAEYKHQRVFPLATLSPWINDERFNAAYTHIAHHTLVDVYRCYELWSLAQQIKHVEGAILEVGVWRGGTGAILATAAPQKTVYLAGTFRGVVKPAKMIHATKAVNTLIPTKKWSYNFYMNLH